VSSSSESSTYVLRGARRGVASDDVLADRDTDVFDEALAGLVTPEGPAFCDVDEECPAPEDLPAGWANEAEGAFARSEFEATPLTCAGCLLGERVGIIDSVI